MQYTSPYTSDKGQSGCKRVLKILGALLSTAPYINFSGLILSVHAELSLYSEVQYLMNVF